jgi:acetyl-CoA carboxylase biotin carboxylase subunit
VPPYYDSLIAKVIAHGGNREQAMLAMRGALARCGVTGVATNIAMHQALLDTAEFRRGGVDTSYLERQMGLTVAAYPVMADDEPGTAGVTRASGVTGG